MTVALAQRGGISVFHRSPFLALLSQMQLSSNDESSRNTTNQYRRLQFRPIATDRATILAEIESEEVAVVNLEYRLALISKPVSPMITYRQVSTQDHSESISSPPENIPKRSQTPLYPSSLYNPMNAELADALLGEGRSGRGRKSSKVSSIELFRYTKSP
jgi:hypothetical protein